MPYPSLLPHVNVRGMDQVPCVSFGRARAGRASSPTTARSGRHAAVAWPWAREHDPQPFTQLAQWLTSGLGTCRGRALTDFVEESGHEWSTGQDAGVALGGGIVEELGVPLDAVGEGGLAAG